MAVSIEEFLPTLRQRLGLYVPGFSFIATSAFIAGYRWGSDDGTLAGFHDWMAARGSNRPQLGWPWLVLCEIYPPDELPDPRGFTEEQDREAIDMMFDLLLEYYRRRTHPSEAESDDSSTRGVGS